MSFYLNNLTPSISKLTVEIEGQQGEMIFYKGQPVAFKDELGNERILDTCPTFVFNRIGYKESKRLSQEEFDTYML